jgi:hypothetical protein
LIGLVTEPPAADELTVAWLQGKCVACIAAVLKTLR